MPRGAAALGALQNEKRLGRKALPRGACSVGGLTKVKTPRAKSRLHLRSRPDANNFKTTKIGSGEDILGHVELHSGFFFEKKKIIKNGSGFFFFAQGHLNLKMAVSETKEGEGGGAHETGLGIFI